MTLTPATNRGRLLDTLREQIAPEANDEELAWLAAVGQRLDLDPIAGQLVLIGRWDSRIGRKVHRPQITVDGRLLLAQRTGEYNGADGPEWTGPRNERGEHDWVEVWDGDTPPHAARCIVYRKGRDHPANGTVRWQEFAQWTGTPPRLMPTWASMPSHMLGKVALSLGLRRAFPDVIPADADVDDDFAPYERVEADGNGEIVGQSGRAIDPPTTSDPAGPTLSEDDPDVVALKARINGFDASDRADWRNYLDAQKWRWPPAGVAQLGAMQREVERIAQAGWERRASYGEGSPYD
jgi:hypothetical protein